MLLKEYAQWNPSMAVWSQGKLGVAKTAVSTGWLLYVALSVAVNEQNMPY